MGAVTMEVWQVVAGLALTGVAGWLAKHHFGGAAPSPGPAPVTVPAVPVPAQPQDVAGKLPGWAGFALKFARALETGQAANPQLQPLVTTLRGLVHDELLALTGIDIGGPAGIPSPPVAPAVKGGGA